MLTLQLLADFDWGQVGDSALRGAIIGGAIGLVVAIVMGISKAMGKKKGDPGEETRPGKK